jgi:hypothetical protein
MRRLKSNKESKDYREDQSTESYEFKSVDFRNYDLFNFQSNKDQSEEPEQIIEPKDIQLCELNSSLVEEHKSFVPITNNLTMKSNIKENNATASYLLALNQYEEPEDEAEEENDSITQLSSNKGKEPRHIRLPSVILINIRERIILSIVSLKKNSQIFTQTLNYQ